MEVNSAKDCVFSVTRNKLILHLDARNVIFVADKSSRLSVEEGLSAYLTGTLWGIDDGQGGWKTASDDIHLRSPCPGAQTVYRLIEQNFVRKPEDRPLLRRHLGSFVDTAEGARFRPLRNQALVQLRWPHEANERLTVKGIDGNYYHYLLPAFLKLLAHLSETGRDFTLVIRTFGRDSSNVREALADVFAGKHPDYPQGMELPISNQIENLKRMDGEQFEYTYQKEGGEQICLTSERDIWERWNEAKGLITVVDDFAYWHAHKYNYTAAKPLWFEQPGCKTRNVHHILFDDNARVGDEDTYVNIRSFTHPDSNTAHTVLMKDFPTYDNALFVQANLFGIIANSRYFIDVLEQCEKNWVRLSKQ